ncbi:hypothetical protein A3Q56_02593 [Intoshia linei]|uniref:Uncharacterized protein n=1 Tax=Intoshia linei TaxID=1819745 RepID=A0A177B5W0_9BILA|nr:hypothetical protein A3Q56_02593 [Intoshia linei]
MSAFIGNELCIESLQNDVVDINRLIIKLIGNVDEDFKTLSWKFPNKNALHIDIDSLIECHKFVPNCMQNKEPTDNEVNHIVSLELLIDRCMLMFEVTNHLLEKQIGCTTSDDCSKSLTETIQSLYSHLEQIKSFGLKNFDYYSNSNKTSEPSEKMINEKLDTNSLKPFQKLLNSDDSEALLILDEIAEQLKSHLGNQHIPSKLQNSEIRENEIEKFYENLCCDLQRLLKYYSQQKMEKDELSIKCEKIEKNLKFHSLLSLNCQKELKNDKNTFQTKIDSLDEDIKQLHLQIKMKDDLLNLKNVKIEKFIKDENISVMEKKELLKKNEILEQSKEELNFIKESFKLVNKNNTEMEQKLNQIKSENKILNSKNNEIIQENEINCKNIDNIQNHNKELDKKRKSLIDKLVEIDQKYENLKCENITLKENNNKECTKNEKLNEKILMKNMENKTLKKKSDKFEIELKNQINLLKEKREKIINLNDEIIKLKENDRLLEKNYPEFNANVTEDQNDMKKTNVAYDMNMQIKANIRRIEKMKKQNIELNCLIKEISTKKTETNDSCYESNLTDIKDNEKENMYTSKDYDLLFEQHVDKASENKKQINNETLNAIGIYSHIKKLNTISDENSNTSSAQRRILVSHRKSNRRYCCNSCKRSYLSVHALKSHEMYCSM